MNNTAHSVNRPQQRRMRWLALLMVVAILGISGFQVFWLGENYNREQKSLAIKTDNSFRETIRHLQMTKLKIDILPAIPGKRIFVSDVGDDHHDLPGKEEMVSTINVIRDKMMDSVKKEMKGVVISMDKRNSRITGDTVEFTNKIGGRPVSKDYIFNLLYGVDSLQDTIKVAEINAAYSSQLKKQQINIPFSVSRIDYAVKRDDAPKGVVVGFAKPVTYQLHLGNTTPYLIRQIMQPILFSILLLGVTILTFVLLYRNLLRQQRLGELKNEFISNITHELKTPIATVGVAIEALKNFNAIQDPERTREYLDISANELHRLSLLVDKVLKLSMFEKKEIELKFEPVDLNALVEEVVSSLRLQFEKHQAKVTVRADGDTNVVGDRLHLVSVIFNLLDNALKYGKDSSVILIEIKGMEERVELSVSDNGIGIPAAFKDKIFEKFFRVPHGDTHNAKGYGLGLSYVAQVVNKHNGQIFAESEEGKGTVFTILLPRHPEA